MFSGLRRLLERSIKGKNSQTDGTDQKQESNEYGAGQEEEWPKPDGQGEATAEDAMLRVAAVKMIEIDSQDWIRSVVFAADGKHVLAGGREGKIRWLGTDDGTEVKKPVDARGLVYDIAVSEDGKWIVSGANSGHARVLDAKSGEIKTELKGHEGSAVWAVDVSLDGTKIVTGSDDKSARIWLLLDGKQLLKVKHGSIVDAVKFSPNGLLLATRTWRSVRIFECDNGRRLAKIKIKAASESLYNQLVAWHHNSKHLFVASICHVYHLDALTGNMLSKWRIHSDYRPRCIALASDSAYIAASAGPSVSFWDTVTHEQLGSSIQHADNVSSMGISTTHDIVTSAGKTITMQNLHDILPAHYCENTSQNLHADLMDLQRRYKAQSCKLRQIAALKAELGRRKHSFALKMDKLAAVHRKLDQFPDVSRELAFTRNELRWSEARLHEIDQQSNDQLQYITSTVANSQPDFPTLHHCITGLDTSVEKGMVRTLDELNTAIQQTSMSISTYFIHHIKSPNVEEQTSAVQRISNSESLPQSLVHHLLIMTCHSLPWYLPVALRAYLTAYLYLVISSWTRNEEASRLVGNMYKRVCKSETPTFAVSWRSLTSTNLPSRASTEDSDIFVSHVMRGLADVVIVAGCAASASDTQTKMSPKFWNNIASIIATAEMLRDSIGGALLADFKVVLARPTQAFDRCTMVVDHQTGLGTAARGKVLCTTRLGLIKEVVRGQNDTSTITTVVKAAVVLQENR